MLGDIVLGGLNKLLAMVKENEDEFVQTAMSNFIQKQSSGLAKAKKKLKQAESIFSRLTFTTALIWLFQRYLQKLESTVKRLHNRYGMRSVLRG